MASARRRCGFGPEGSGSDWAAIAAAAAVLVSTLTPSQQAWAQPEPSSPEGVTAPEPESGQPAEEPGQQAADLASEESLARFHQLLQRRPFHGPAFSGLVNHHVERGKLGDLIAEYAARVEALPEEVASRIVLSRLHLRAGDAAAAAAVLETVDRLPPEMSRMTTELLVFRSEIYSRTGDQAAAERMLREAIPLAGSVSERLRLGEALADLHIRGGRKDEAVAALRTLAAEFPDNYLHQKQIADALAQRNLLEAASEQFRGMLLLVQDQVERRCEVLRELGQCLERLGNRDEAIAAYVEAIGLLASDHWLQRDLHERVVTLYRATGRLADLATYCQGQIQRAPEQTGMRILLADVQAAMGNPESGEETLAEAVRLFPADLALSQKRVDFLDRLGKAEAAAAEYQRAIGQHPEDAELYIAYGQYLASNRQIEAARNQWRHVLSTRVTDAGLATRLGSLFEAYELHEDAGDAYERAMALAPAQPDAYMAQSRLWLSRGEPAKALETLERMGAANPDDGAMQASLAQALRSFGQTDRALEAITRACELLPEQVRFHQIRADLLVQAGRLEDSLQVRRDSIERISNPVQRAEAINMLVSMHASADRLEALKQREQQRLEQQPQDVAAMLLLARAADVERNFPEVKRWLDGLLAVDPGNESALQHLAKLQDATGDIDAATQTYGRLIQRYPARARQYYEGIVDLNLRYGDRAGAIEALEQMARNDPESAAVLSAVAEQLVRMGEAERALGFYERCLQLHQDRHDIRLDYGKALVDAGRLEDALSAFRAVATQRTDTDKAVEALGRLHETATQLGQLEELIDELHQIVRADPAATQVARALAQLLVRELEYNRAMELLELVLRHNPRDADLALGRGELLRRLARFDEAVEAYRHVLRLPQIDRDYVLGEMGKAYFESGQVEQAKRLWRQIQHKLYAGSLLKNNGLLDESVAVFEEGIRLKPDDFALHRNLIGALEAAGKTTEALDAARRLLDLEPGNALNIQRLAEAYLRNGDRAAAARVAARLFSAGVGVDRASQPAASQQQQGMANFAMAMYQAMYAQSSWGSYYSQGQQRNNLGRGISFFLENGLRAELEEILQEQLSAQPENALLKQAAADVFTSELNKPELAMSLLRELETAQFPVEQQQWLGQCSQQDFYRVKQYNLIASKPALRDAELVSLEALKPEDRGRDQVLALAIIRNAQGNTDDAAALLEEAVRLDERDTLSRGILVDLLIAAEKFAQAEPHAARLAALLAEQQEQMMAETIERVRRDFVRSLPLEFQLRMTDELLADIAEKWTLGQTFSWWSDGEVQTTGYLRAQLNLGTIYAETGRFEDARALWQSLAPQRGPDVDRWTMLGDAAQLHKQDDLAFEFYQQALRAARRLAGDPLLQQIYTSTLTTMSWYGQDGTISAVFSSILEAFAGRDGMVEMYDFLRDTGQDSKARIIAERFNLRERLIPLYEQRVSEAAAAYRALTDRPLDASVGYFAQVCKLAELHDQSGDWDGAKAVYEAYLEDFPDELGLLLTLSEVAEAQLKTGEAIEWEKRALETKTRLARRAREWTMRELTLLPARPQALAGRRADYWGWMTRWGLNRWSYGSSLGPLDRSTSWMRLAQLYLADNNTIAAADAMQRAVADSAGRNRDNVTRQVVDLIQARQLSGQMLPVLRTLAVYAPADERVQLAFADSLEASGKPELAAEVCSRLLRRGVSDLSVLAQVRRRLESASPESAPPQVTLATLEAEAAADPDNLRAALRLGKAYFYSLEVDKAARTLAELAEKAPHLEDVHELLVESYTILGDSERLIAALRTQIERIKEADKRRTVRWRLVDELLATGQNEEALAAAKELASAKDPSSYARIGWLLQYFGRHDEAIESFKQAGRNQSRQPWDRDGADFAVAQSLALRGDIAGAADAVLKAVDDQQKQQVQYGGMFSFFEGTENPFAQLEPALAIVPELASEMLAKLESRREAKPGDPQTIKLLMSLHRSLGRPDRAEALLEETAAGAAADQTLVSQVIDLAVERKEYERAITLAQRFIEQQPRPKLPPGIPPQYAGWAIMGSPRTVMVCKLGDVYWEMGDQDKALETYRQIVDEKVEETRVAYASICLLRGRVDEARTIIDQALEAHRVKPPQLLQFRALIAALDGDAKLAFDCLADGVAPAGQTADPYGMGSSAVPVATLGTFARHTGQFERFVEFVQARIAKNPQEWDNYQTLAGAYFEAGQDRAGFAVLDQAAEVSSLTLQALQGRMSRLAAIAEDDELIPLYEQLIELTERNVQAASAPSWQPYGYRGGGGGTSSAQSYRDALGSILWDRGSRDDAERIWTERLSPQQAATHIKVGQLYLARQEYGLADEAFARALALEPENTTAHMALAESAQCRGDRAAMLKHMHECFIRRPIGQDDSRRRWDASGNWTTGDNRLTRWAVEITHDPELTMLLSGEDPRTAADYRLMLTALSGDWEELEAELSARLEAGSHDPMVWTLWAQSQQRKGNWHEAARALDFVRRAGQTSIGQHRTQLELVLAGKQVKEAAAGTRQAQAAAAGAAQAQAYGAAAAYAYSYGGYYGWDSGGAGSNTQLAAIHARLGEFEKAERLYLVSSSGGGVQASLPALSALMWERQARDRALELMRWSLLLDSGRYSSGRQTMPQYASMLAEMGRAQEAVDVLIRAYRRDSSGQGSTPSFMYGYSGGSDPQFEQYSEQTFATSLYEILTRTGRLDETLAELSRQATEDPHDERLAKLILSLQKQARRWDQLRDSLSAWRATRPDDLPMKLEQWHAECQLGRWDDALALLAEIRREAPEQAARWAVHEAFVHLMRDDVDAAVAAIGPVLDDPAMLGQLSVRGGPAVVLAAAGRYEALTAHLQDLRQSGGLRDAGGVQLLVRSLTAQGQFAEALQIALEQLWRQTEALDSTDPWYRAVVRIVSDAAAAGANPPSPPRAEDAALLTLITGGPRAGIDAFAKLIETDEESVDALRGLLLAAQIAGDDELAVRANVRLMEFLSPRRLSAWHVIPPPPLDRAARQWLAQMSRAGNAQSALQGSMMLPQAMQTLTTGSQTVTFDSLWRSHQRLHQELIARTADVDDLRALLRWQVRRLRGSGSTDPYAAYGYSPGFYPGGMYSYSGGYDPDGADQDWAATSDVRANLWRSLWRAGRLGDLAGEILAAGCRIPDAERSIAAEAIAASGDFDEAARQRRLTARTLLAQARVSSAVPAGTTYDPWRRQQFISSGRDAAMLRPALQVQIVPTDASPERNTPNRGQLDELWEIALADPDLERQLAGAAAQITPGSGATELLRQLISYLDARGEHGRIIDLLTTAHPDEQLARSADVGAYIRACLKSGSYDRLDGEGLLERIAQSSASLRNDVDLLRLVILRRQGRSAEADALEQQLLGRCITEAVNPRRIAAQLRDNEADTTSARRRAAAAQARQAAMYARSYRSGSAEMPLFGQTTTLGELRSLNDLATILGVRYDPKAALEDLTLMRIRTIYQRQGLHADAARILEREIAEAADFIQRADLMTWLALEQHRAGLSDKAAQTARELEAAMTDRLRENPGDPGLHWRLAVLHRMPAAGARHDRAMESLAAAKALDPGFDPAGVLAVNFLYKLGRYDEAWAVCRAAMKQGMTELYDEPAIHYAALSALRSGDREAGIPLARQALHRFPLNILAEEIRELIHERD